MNITIRKATPADKDFIINAIIEAEKGGSDTISFCAIFSLTETKFRELLSEILDEDIEGQELCISGYLIAEVDGEKAATMGGWIEMEEGMASNIIKTNLLMHFLGRDAILNAASSISLMNEIDIHREENTLQLEVSYTLEKFRGLGLYGKLINERIRLNKERGATFNKVQGIIMKNNINPFNALNRLGFTNVLERQCTNKDILKILASDTKVLMEKTINS